VVDLAISYKIDREIYWYCSWASKRHDSPHRLSLAFGLPATPMLDAEGCILGSLNGPADWAGEDAKNRVRTAQGK